MRSVHPALATSCFVILTACASEDKQTAQDPLHSGVAPSATGGQSVAPQSGVTSSDGTSSGNATGGVNTGASNTTGSATGGTDTAQDVSTGSDNGTSPEGTNTDESQPGVSTSDGTNDDTGVSTGGSDTTSGDSAETSTGDASSGANTDETDTDASTGEGTTDTTSDTSDETESDETCPLPTSFNWTSTGAIAQPRSGWASIKDFTAVVHEGQYIVYMTNHDTGTSWGAAMFMFDDWSGAGTATQQPMGRTSVAPTLFYFAPKDIWVLAYQWGATSFSYATSNDPTDPGSWSAEQNLYNYTGSLPNSGTGPIDQHVICDDTDCYLFFNGDNGEIYRSSMPIGDFPGTFGPHETIMSRSTNELFEAVAVYSIKGSDEYLMLMESIGTNGRYFSAFTATELGGEWTDLKTRENDPFAGRANVTFQGNAWTTDISHGDIVRRNPDQTMEIDPCHMELLYQGRDPGINTEYGLLPYRPGVLTLVR